MTLDLEHLGHIIRAHRLLPLSLVLFCEYSNKFVHTSKQLTLEHLATQTLYSLSLYQVHSIQHSPKVHLIKPGN